jgi:integrase
MRDVNVFGPRPYIQVRKDNTKGEEHKRKARRVPLHWDRGTLEAIASWYSQRIGEGALPCDPFVVKRRAGQNGERMKVQAVSRRWFTALKPLGPGRIEQLTIHSGRHSFISHALAIGRSLVEVKNAAGHANIATTSIYLHLIEREGIPDVFGTTPRESK